MNAGANVHHQDRHGETTLMYALNCSNKNQREMLEILLKRGVDPTVPDHFGYIVMHRAVQKYRCIEKSNITGCISNDIR